MKRKGFYKSSICCMLLFAAMFWTATLHAVPAKPGLWRWLTLADGTKVEARLVGDEHGHYWLGKDGTAYQTAAAAGFYEAASAEAIAAKAQLRRQQASQRRHQRLARQHKVGNVGNYTGKKKGIILLVNFSDTTFNKANTNALYQRIANEENFSYGKFKGSMRDYFYQQSEGQFELTFDVVGPLTVANTQAYYGQNDSQDFDAHPAEMIIEACKLADSQVNFADYDWDGDGYVDQVYVVYAGKGEADGGADDTIWPHEWDLASARQNGDGTGALKLDGVTINTYACGGELNGLTGEVAGIGTMCHEFSHCLGYPDFYDTDYSGGQGMGYWDLMDSGSYNDDGYQPAGYTSYERWVAGWKEPIELNSTTQVDHLAALQDGGNAYIIYNKGNQNEFFLLENRQPTGWDASLPGSGLLILHTDYNATAWANNTPNDTPSHQRMTWVPADNKFQSTTYNGSKYYTFEGMATDPFPYASNNAFSKSTTPAASFYNRNTDGTYYMDGAVENITQNADGTVSFRYKGVSTVAKPTFSPAAGTYAEAQTVTLSCTTDGAAIHYTTDGTTPTAQSATYTAPLTIDATTTLKAIACTDDDESDVAVARYVIRTGATTERPTTFRRATSTADLANGLRCIIACGSKQTAAGALSGKYLSKTDVEAEGDLITIGDDVLVLTMLGSGSSYSFVNDDDQYLYAKAAKEVAFGENEYLWTLANDQDGVSMTYNLFGTMRYNVNSPRFTTYTSSASSSMITANIYVEETGGTGTQPVQPGEGKGRYQLIRNDSQLEAGKNYLLVGYDKAANQHAAYNGFNTNKGDASTVKPANDIIDLSDGTTQAVPVRLDDEGNAMWSIYDTSAQAYIGTTTASDSKSKNRAYLTSAASVESLFYTWTVSIDADGVATILNNGKDFYLRFNYNQGASLFRVYASNQDDVYLYKETEQAPTTDVPTGIATTEAADGTPAPVYDLQGRRVSHPRAGLYIVGGKKLLVR